MNTMKKMGKRKHCGSSRHFLPILLLLIVLAVGVIGAESVFAQTSITLKPGANYDVAKAGKNTSVYINKPGTYTLTGKSRYVRVVICCGDVKCYLDGVNLNAGIYTNTGRRASPLNIVNDGGTVKLISKKGTKNYFEGYMNPGICKNGTKTKLVFETEKPSSPGTIEAKGGVDAAGIGCVMYVSASPWYTDPTGNYTINSGNIIARGGRQSAGFGGSFSGSLNGLTINGGNVKAYGNGDGAGIGAGYHGRAENINITGGTVYAENQQGRSSGAAIGGGGGYDYEGADAYGKNITISGGHVTAVSGTDGAAIGGGANSDGKNIKITGGTVDVKAYGKHSLRTPAIGGGGGRFPGDAKVSITGGYVKAKGGEDAVAIGSGGGQSGYTVSVKVDISGGVVIAEKGDEHASSSGHNDKCIGSSTTHDDDVSVCITGGSVYAGKIQNAKNDDGDKLHRVDVTCKNIGTRSDIDYFLKDAVCTNGYSYGLNDVQLIHIDEDDRTGMFYPWLPDTNEKIKQCKLIIQGDNEDYYRYGDFKFSASKGNLISPTGITLDVGTVGVEEKSGHAFGIPGEKKLDIDRMPAVVPTKVILGYAWGSTEEDIVAEPDGTLRPNTIFTNSDGEWTCTDDQKGLNVIKGPIKYTVHYDANVPKNASTKNKISGSVDDQTFTYGAGKPLQSLSDAYNLPGYELAAWIDKDGNFMEDEQGNPIQPDYLADKDGAVITAYAYWVPKSYTIKFKSGIDGFEDRYQTVRFDQTHTLKPVSEMGWDYPDHTLHGWTAEGEIGSFFEDGGTFWNLCDMDAEGKLKGKTLTASWVGNGRINVTTTVDGAPAHITSNSSSMKLSLQGDASANGIILEDTENDPGHYSCSLGGIAEGRYLLSLDGDTQYQIPVQKQDLGTLSETSAVSVVINYNTVTTDGDEHIRSAFIRETGTSRPETSMVVAGGTEILVGASAEEGYHFDGYSSLGVKPVFKQGDLSIANQALLVRGNVDLTAHSEANVYTVHFDANTATGLSGKMEDQDMVYDQEQNLFANRFKRVGGVFTGWNTEKDGSGTNYEDAESVKNLTTANGGKITLYAQWKMTQYDIEYDLDEGHLPGDELNPTKYTADDSFTLFNPVREDYDFLGWIGTDVDTPSTTVTIPENSTGNRYYIACWTPIEYNVVFNSNGGSDVDSQVVRIHGKAVKPADPTREHYSFAGWYKDKALKKAFNFNTEITKNLTLYARWNPLKYKVSFATNGGSKVKAQTVSYGREAKKPAAPTRKGYTFKGWFANKKLTKSFSFKTKITKNTTVYAKWKANPKPQPKPKKKKKVSGTLLVRMTAKGKRTLKFKWTKISGADGYDIFAARCNHGGREIYCKKVKTIKGNKTFTWSRTVLRTKKPYKAYVKAWVKKNGKKKYVRTSPMVHAYTAGGSKKKYTSPKSVTVKKTKISLRTGRKYKIKAKVIKLKKGRKLMPSGHAPALRYLSSNKKIATVSSAGQIRAKAKGTCCVYVYTHNGIFKKMKVTVK